MTIGEIREIPLDRIEPDPGQPRQTFDEAQLQELAASISRQGLLQPITVREQPGGRYLLVAGERRYRAHKIAGMATVRAIVRPPESRAKHRIQQIIENDQRADVAPLEQARSYQSLMDEEGWTVEQLAAELGKEPHRIRERTDLLKLEPEYQKLLASGNLKPSQAYEMSRLGARGQRTLFQAIRAGQCESYGNLRAVATALVEAESQISLVPEEVPMDAPSDQERSQSRSFEAKLDQVAAMLRAGITDNQIEAVKKVNPHKAAHYADLLGAMQADIRRIEVALRRAAAQASLFSLAG